LAAAEPTSYYMMVFASQDGSNRLKPSHTFATFVKATGKGHDAKLESHTISWLPESLNIVVLRSEPEPGKNFDLPSTLRWAQSLRARVTMWGPYTIKKGLYERAIRQVERLNKRAILYKAVDARFRPQKASNCIHAVADIDTENGLLETGISRGEAASQMVVSHLGRWIIDPKTTRPWVSKRLGLDKYSITVVARK
jgi:hypothetical protein